MTSAASFPGDFRVGLITDTDDAAMLTAAITAAPSLHLVAQVADFTPTPDVQRFDDSRALIAQAGVEAVVLGSSVRFGVDTSRLAVERRVHVWRMPPHGRSFAETTDLLRQAREQDVYLHAASWWSHIRDEVRAALAVEAPFRSSCAEIRIASVGPALDSWKSSLPSAGGGVLTAEGYAWLECLVALCGVPESVSAKIGRCRSGGALAPRETEDFAELLMRFSDGGCVSILTFWDIPPYDAYAQFHAASSTLRIERNRAVTINISGGTTQAQGFKADFLSADLERFVRAVHSPREAAILADQERHVAVASILETAYLSARTGQPEVPRQLYEAQRWIDPIR